MDGDSLQKGLEVQVNKVLDKVSYTRKMMYARIRKTYAREMEID